MDLASKFEQSALPSHDDVSPSYIHSLPSPPAEASTFRESCDQFDISYAVAMTEASNQSASLRCRRLQRQMNTHLLCTATQARSISAMVEDMVSTGSQCNVSAAPSLPTPSSAALPSVNPQDIASLQVPLLVDDSVDEGFFDGEEEDENSPEAVERMMMNLRRAQGPSGIRKYSSTVHLRLGDRNLPGGVVACLPRIRKRIAKRRPLS